jgi:hypothetical protein
VILHRIYPIDVTIESRLFLDIPLMSILGTLTLDISAPTAQLSRDLDKAASMIRESSSRMIPTIGISAALQKDLRTGRSILNNSMQQMESDLGRYDLDNYSQEVDDLNSTKITPKVDDSQLTALNKHLSLKEEHLDHVVQKFSSQKIKPNFVAGDKIPDQSFNVTVNLRPESQEQIAKSTSRAIEKGLAQSKGKGLSPVSYTHLRAHETG